MRRNNGYSVVFTEDAPNTNNDAFAGEYQLVDNYQEGAAASVYTKNTVEANNIFSLLQGHDPGTDTFDSTQRYLFSDYAVKNKDGFKLWLTYTNGTVTKAQVRINPNNAANGSAPLDVTVP